MDMLNGEANGFPPLHLEMQPEHWATRALHAAFAQLQNLRLLSQPLPIDGYALEYPVEFFAVASEIFFQTPAVRTAALRKFTHSCEFFIVKTDATHEKAIIASAISLPGLR